MIFWGMAGRTWRRSGRQRKQAPAIAAASLMPRHTGFRGTQWNVARRPVMMFVLLLLLGAPCAAAVDYYGGPEVIRPLGEIYRTSLTAEAFAADPYILLENATLPTWLGYCLDPILFELVFALHGFLHLTCWAVEGVRRRTGVRLLMKDTRDAGAR